MPLILMFANSSIVSVILITNSLAFTHYFLIDSKSLPYTTLELNSPVYPLLI
jgi:hypothetical protein